MRRTFILGLMILATSVFAAAQITTITNDVLGAHLNYGRGCPACHAPHSGAFGNGFSTSDTTTGNVALWGQDVSPLSGYGGTLLFGQMDNGTTFNEPLPSSFATSTPDVGGLMTCLSCHDGNYAKGGHMLNQVYETLPVTYGPVKPPTLLGNDGTTAGNYLNDHPAGLNAVFSCNTPPTGQTYGGESGYNWDCGVAVNTSGRVVVTAGPNMANFVNNYGFFVNLQNYNGNPVVVCTTCHNQHVMNVVNVHTSTTSSAAGSAVGGQTGLPSGTYATMFFLRGPYNPNDANQNTNQTAQFCRQCHGGESNEMNGSTAGTVF